nr:hypothetical protein [Kofleriaceae bacterium]
MDPRLRVLFVVVVTVGLFLLRTAGEVAIACAALAAMWLALGLGPLRLVRAIARLWALAALILVFYSLFPSPAADTDRWIELSAAGHALRVNAGGFELGLLMFLRIVAIVLASQLARAGDPRALGAGLAKLHVPETAAIAIDTVLALFGGRPAASSRPRAGFVATLRTIAKGDVSPLMSRVHEQIDRAERHVAETRPAAAAAVARDVAVIAGIALVMLWIKSLKLIPHVPLAPGHKLVLQTPLYFLAAKLTRTRFGATLAGATLGVTDFLLGGGNKFGVFEIFEHVTPGVLADLGVPLLTAHGRTPGRLAWTLLGGVIGAGRFAVTLAFTFVLEAPSAAYAILLPGLGFHILFGLASGFVTYRVMQSLPDAAPAETSGSVAPDAPDAPATSRVVG